MIVCITQESFQLISSHKFFYNFFIFVDIIKYFIIILHTCVFCYVSIWYNLDAKISVMNIYLFRKCKFYSFSEYKLKT